METITYNLYCDESCHMENDEQKIILLGGVWCPKRETRTISDKIRSIKVCHNARGELKWTKVSPSKQNFYLELVDYFFSTPTLH